ncbi:hypothetical protein WJX72_000288 [[Myrmecia] bisecta]|uniref:D-isomer specific 2-hydroxyacid dehydrogenase NAD-binding domain-containing protein n=1 Tax=[Myrmecia] bisecta TaxID=41462 RepID=A0AAW1Q6X3_9CHLO
MTAVQFHVSKISIPPEDCRTIEAVADQHSCMLVRHVTKLAVTCQVSQPFLLPLTGRSTYPIPFSRNSRLQRTQRTHKACRVENMGAAAAEEAKAHILVLTDPEAPELEVLEKLPQGARVVAIAKDLEGLKGLSQDEWDSVNVLVRGGFKNIVKDVWPKLKNLQWVHSTPVGVDSLLFDELVHSATVVTNSRGCYSNSLAEFAVASCKWFALDMPRMLAQKKARIFEAFDVEELRGKTMGVVGYGDIGQTCAALGRAFQMNLIAVRRRTELTQKEHEQHLKVYPPNQLHRLMAESDYVVLALPATPATKHMINKAAIAAMKPTGVLVNVGRGSTLVEAALVEALQEGRIKGAALDVFEVEPLPTESPLWDLPNVLMTPHTADRTKQFQHDAMEVFVANLKRFLAGEELQFLVDKHVGY